MINYSQIGAPFEARIQALMTEVGDQTVPFLKSLIELVDESTLKAVVSVPQVDRVRLKPGLAVSIHVPAVELQLAASVDRIYPVLDAVTRNATFEACLNCDRPASALASLYPGMAVDAVVELKRYVAALSIPHQALQQRGNTQGVFVATDGKAHWRPLQPAEVSDGRVRIAAGLQPGERVIVTPDPRLKDGLAVTVVAAVEGIVE